MNSTLILTHGAGSDRNAPLLVALDRAFGESGLSVERVNLHFREQRATGPPFRHEAAKDRERLCQLTRAARTNGAARVYLGGHSYGGRQCTIAAAEKADLADALLLASYPLHPPRKPQGLRTAHFPDLRTPALFIHGSRDPFGSVAEMERAVALIAGPAELFVIDGASHELIGRNAAKAARVAEAVVGKFLDFLSRAINRPF
jgi:predicted alpha/beta-hydrolase family hydrolase